MGHNSLTWVKQPLHICRCCATSPQQLGQKFDSVVKRSSQDLHLNKAGRPCVSDAIHQDLASKHSWFWSVLTIYEHDSPILFNSAKPFEQIVSTTSTEGPMWNLAKNGKRFQRSRHLMIYTIFYMHKALGQGQIPLGDTILIVNNKFYYVYYFNFTL